MPTESPWTAHAGTLFGRTMYVLRNIESRDLFRAIQHHATGNVLDVGGRDFFRDALRHGCTPTTWTTLEPATSYAPPT